MVNKKHIIIGFLTLLLIGSISIFVVGAETREEGKTLGFGRGLRLHRKEGCKGIHDKTSFSDKLKEKLDLPEDATEEEIKEAIKQYKEAHREEWNKKVKEKLGLPEDATEDEVKEAMKKWKEENKDHRGRHRHKKWGPYKEST